MSKCRRGSVLVPPADDLAAAVLVNGEIANRAWLLNLAYRRFNRGDLDEVLALMCVDVDWPNTLEGGRERGHDEVRSYWARLFSVLRPKLQPIAFSQEEGRVAVMVRQQVMNPKGTPLAYQRLIHRYSFRDELIARMDACSPRRSARR